MVRCIIRLFRGWDVTSPCINSSAYFPESANGLLASFPHTGLANCGDARSPPATSWQTEVLLLCDKRSPDYHRALVGVQWSFGVKSVWTMTLAIFEGPK